LGSRAPFAFGPSPSPQRRAAGRPFGIRPAPAPRGFLNHSGPVRFGSTAGASHRQPYNGDRHGGSGHYHHGDGDHHHHWNVYFNAFGYPYYPWYYGTPLFTGYVDPWLFGPGWNDYDSFSSPYNGYGGYSAYNGYDTDPPAPYKEYGTQPYPQQDRDDQPAQPQASYQWPAYAPAQPQRESQSSTTVGRELPLTLVYKDGRPAEQIHNYLLTATKLTVLEPHYREIPLDEVNIAATEQVNRAAGLDFRVPRSR